MLPGPTAMLLGAVLTVSGSAAPTLSSDSGGGLGWPVPGAIVSEFDPPYPDWLPGHRGLDLAAPVGQVIRSPRRGVVTFSGPVAGTDVIVIRYGVVQATFLPAVSDLSEGDSVGVGDEVGLVTVGAHCPESCLHWGARANGRYVDPRVLLGGFHVILTPLAD